MPKRKTDKLGRARARPDPAQWSDDGAMTLVEATAVFLAINQEAPPSSEDRQPPAPSPCALAEDRPHRTEELRAADLMKDGEQIRFVVNRMHDGQALAGKTRSAKAF
jgi:hypothetical protein